jgi:PIN domain nuclease of toxin-antitoxin system
MAGSPRLSSTAAAALRDAEAWEGVVVSTATIIDLWYVTQTTKQVEAKDVDGLRTKVNQSPAWSLHPVDEHVADAMTRIPRGVVSDPWDRLIVATALVLGLPLVTRTSPTSSTLSSTVVSGSRSSGGARSSPASSRSELAGDAK